MSEPQTGSFGWLSIVRLGLVQAALGSIVVLTTSTMNRVMAVELALPVTVPGILVAIHNAVQMSRPRWGHGSDVGGRRTPWIIGGMAVLAIGGLLAALAIGLMVISRPAGLILAVVAFILIGIGVGAAGTSLLALLAKQTAPTLRPAAATTVWVMMIVGFILTTAIVGHYLDPYSAGRLIIITAIVAALAFSISVLALWGVEPGVSLQARRTRRRPVARHRHSPSPSPKYRTSRALASSQSMFSSPCSLIARKS